LCKWGRILPIRLPAWPPGGALGLGPAGAEASRAGAFVGPSRWQALDAIPHPNTYCVSPCSGTFRPPHTDRGKKMEAFGCDNFPHSPTQQDKHIHTHTYTHTPTCAHTYKHTHTPSHLNSHKPIPTHPTHPHHHTYTSEPHTQLPTPALPHALAPGGPGRQLPAMLVPSCHTRGSARNFAAGVGRAAPPCCCCGCWASRILRAEEGRGSEWSDNHSDIAKTCGKNRARPRKRSRSQHEDNVALN